MLFDAHAPGLRPLLSDPDPFRPAFLAKAHPPGRLLAVV
ncbi:hypothetical protein NY78_4015 [Desulfovibrio sp. TomC]|nr:hypothetical protein NY78_4015 [Desulfovibrio sp. TomC]